MLETFYQFSQELPTNNLGFVDPKADTLELEIAGHNYIIRQSTGLLNSIREKGTTGAVLWKITPLLAAWLASKPSVLADIIHEGAVVVELGCGVAGLIGLVLSRIVQCYILTDLGYVLQHLKANIAANAVASRRDKKVARKKKYSPQKEPANDDVLKTLALDWENDSAQNLKTVMAEGSSVDLLLLCDCVYNEYLIRPLVQTCIDICQQGHTGGKATVVLLAQQLRSDTVFEVFVECMMKNFEVWRVPDEKIVGELRPGSGYAVHLAMLKGSGEETP